MMLLSIQLPPGGPSIPWWVVYVVLLAGTFAAYRVSRERVVPGIIVTALAAFVLLVLGVATFGPRTFALVPLLALAPVAAFVLGRRHPPTTFAGQMERITLEPPPRPVPLDVPPPPPPDPVREAALAQARQAAGVPADAEPVARLRYLLGLYEFEPQFVDLLVGGGRLWIAPLVPTAPPLGIPVREVMSPTVWPQFDGPHRLRIAWMPDGGLQSRGAELTVPPDVSAETAEAYLEGVRGKLADRINAVAAAESRAELERELAHTAALLALPAVDCARCGARVPAEVVACEYCGTPR